MFEAYWIKEDGYYWIYVNGFCIEKYETEEDANKAVKRWNEFEENYFHE